MAHDDAYASYNVGIKAAFIEDVIDICPMTSQFLCQPYNAFALFFEAFLYKFPYVYAMLLLHITMLDLEKA